MSIFDFGHAIVRAPGRSVVDGLRDGGGPSPTYQAVAAEHGAYVQALGEAGVIVDALPALEAFPDAIFVEDPALTFAEGAILLRPGAASRIGETTHLRSTLEGHFDSVQMLDEGHADGGDILVLPDVVLIGLSARTDTLGAAALARQLAAIGRASRIVTPPAGALHLKTAVSLLDEETLLTTPAGAASGLFDGYRLMVVPLPEIAAANALRVNRHMLVGSQFPQTIAMLDHAGFALVPLDTRAIGLIDAGLSCMSLRW